MKSLVVGDVSIRQLEGDARRNPHALPGDFVLENSRLRVVVGGPDRPQRERGAILDVRRVGSTSDEGVSAIEPTVHVGNRRFRVDVGTVRAIERAGSAYVRVVGTVALPDGTSLAYAREISLSPTEAAVSIRSKVTPRDGPISVRLSARIGWGGVQPWVPDVGPLSGDAWHDAAFVGAEMKDLAVVYALDEGELRLVAEYDVHGASRLLHDTEAMGPVTVATRAKPAEQRAILAIAGPGLGAAIRRVGWIRGAPFPEALVRLPYAPPGSVVQVSYAGLPVMEVRPDASGHAIVPFVPRATDGPGASVLYSVLATAHGHAASDPVPLRPGDDKTIAIPPGGHVRVVATDASDGSPLAARVRFLPIHKTTLDLGPDWSASGARDSVIAMNGEVVVPVPPGRYRVLVSHGPEWTLADETVEVTATYRPDVRAALVHVIDPGAWIACDLHVHASPSPDSNVSLPDRVASLVAEGIGFAVPTDHNHVTDYATTASDLGLDPSRFLSTRGVEATTGDPHFGHFNAYPVRREAGESEDRPLPAGWPTPTALFETLRGLGDGVLIQVNHPRLEGEIGYFDRVGYDPTTGSARGPYSADYDLLEVWNGFDLAREAATERVFGDWLAMVARGRHVTAVGNSDSHQIRYTWAGYPRTYVRATDRTVDAIVAALRAGHAFVTSGPFLEASIGDAGPGDLATVTDGGAHVDVRVRTAPFTSVDHVEIWMGVTKVVDAPLVPSGGPARPGANTARTYEASFDVPIDHDVAIVVRVRGSTPLDDYFGREKIPPLAFTNPIWIDADGDGRGPLDLGDPPPSPGTWEAVRSATHDASTAATP